MRPTVLVVAVLAAAAAARVLCHRRKPSCGGRLSLSTARGGCDRVLEAAALDILEHERGNTLGIRRGRGEREAETRPVPRQRLDLPGADSKVRRTTSLVTGAIGCSTEWHSDVKKWWRWLNSRLHVRKSAVQWPRQLVLLPRHIAKLLGVQDLVVH